MHFVPAAFTETRNKDLVAFYEPQHSPVSIGSIGYQHDPHNPTVNNYSVYIFTILHIFKNVSITHVSLLVSIRVVFKWIMKGFSGHLLPEQLLNLWDMVIAYDSLEVLPLLAVAILSFRKDNLLQVNTLQNVEVSTVMVEIN